MAKASAQITLHYVIDIQAVYRYYLLQSSTLTKPSKPTTFPPSSSWDDTEPQYVDGSTNSLYFVDCTVFCDNTFKYSDVSLSSSYEAAKTAYNKAVNAQNTANDAHESIENNVETLNQNISDQTEQITRSYEEEIASKLEGYLKSAEYDEFKKSVNAQMEVLDDNITMTFDSIKEQKDSTDALQGKLVELAKYINYGVDGITIGGGDEESGDKITLHLDNKAGISFRKNDNAIGLWNGEDFFTGNIIVSVNERATFGNFSFVPRGDGSLSFLMTAQTTLPVIELTNNVLTIKNTNSLYNNNVAVITDIQTSVSGTIATLEV